MTPRAMARQLVRGAPFLQRLYATIARLDRERIDALKMNAGTLQALNSMEALNRKLAQELAQNGQMNGDLLAAYQDTTVAASKARAAPENFAAKHAG